jgi:hypothetical protein
MGGSSPAAAEVEVDIPFRIPGTTEPEIIIRRGALGNIAVVVGGAPVKRRRGRDLTYDIPLPDGTIKELRLTGQWTGLKTVVDGVETQLEPRVSRILVALIFLPLALVVIGGLISGVIGGVASMVNLAISRAAMRAPLKFAAMFGAAVLAVAIYVGVAFTLAPLPALATGQCINGVREGADLSPRSTRAVSCDQAHDNEVVGTVRYAGEGAYPGQQALFDYAAPSCSSAFATYVGVDFQTSELEMILVTPTDLTWVKGDREVACVALAANAGKLTGSIMGTRR